MVSFIQFENPIGAIAFLSLIPLILLYLIRPRPKPIEIPSLMFFIKSTGAKKLTSFLKQVTKDWLFIIQLLIILLLATIFLQPFSNYTHDISAQNTVLVIDVSASSQVTEDGRTRFDNALTKAKDFLGSKNTLILAKGVPKLALQDATPSETRNFFKTLIPTDSSSQIGDSIILAGELLSGEGRVIVFSDFINTGGQDPEIAKKVLESKGLVVEFINTASAKRNNIGIINIKADTEETTVYIKNFMNTEATVPLKAGTTTRTLNIPPKSIETFTFKTPSGPTKIEIDYKDDFLADNKAYLSVSSDEKTNILLITNDESVYLLNALRASGENIVKIAKPPVIPKDDFDIYIIHNINIKEILPGTFKDIKEKYEKGAQIIIHVQNDSNKINYEGLSPVKIQEQKNSGIILIDQLNSFTKNIDFGFSETTFTTSLETGALSITSVNNNPIIALKQQGISKLVYFGITEDSEFKFSTSYPIFWTELISYLSSKHDINSLNYKTGETLILDREQTIITPTKTIKTSSLILDEAGFYKLEDRIIAVSINNEKESDINIDTTQQETTKGIEYELKPVKEKKQFFWAIPLCILALILLFFELYYSKSRGEL